MWITTRIIAACVPNINVRLVAGGVVLLEAVALAVFLAWLLRGDGDPSTDAGAEAASAQTAVSATPAAPATETPAPTTVRDGCGGSIDGEFFAANQVLSYYGNPYVDTMGILGELSPEDLVASVRDHARAYDALNGHRGMVPALHLVYGTAQPEPGREGKYLLYVDDETLREYIDLACRNKLLIFLDMQIGRSDVEAEVRKVLPYMRDSHVQLALDPEFAMPPGEVPGETIGALDAADINTAQRLVQDYVKEHRLPDKIIVVHQFEDGMITQREMIQDYPRVRLVIDMDGYGPAEIKEVKYGWYAAPAEYAGIKLFFKHDPDLLSESDVLALNPDVIIYQ